MLVMMSEPSHGGSSRYRDNTPSHGDSHVGHDERAVTWLLVRLLVPFPPTLLGTIANDT